MVRNASHRLQHPTRHDCPRTFHVLVQPGRGRQLRAVVWHLPPCRARHGPQRRLRCQIDTGGVALPVRQRPQHPCVPVRRRRAPRRAQHCRAVVLRAAPQLQVRRLPLALVDGRLPLLIRDFARRHSCRRLEGLRPYLEVREAVDPADLLRCHPRRGLDSGLTAGPRR